MQDLASAGQRHGLCRVEGAAHVIAHDLAALAGHRDHAPAVEALDVRTGDREMHGVDLHAGRQLGFLDRLLDRFDGRFEVGDDAPADAMRLGDADADDVEAVFVDQLADNGGDLRGADVESDDVFLVPGHVCSLRAWGRARPYRCADSAVRTGFTYTRPSIRRSTESMTGTCARSVGARSMYICSRSLN